MIRPGTPEDFPVAIRMAGEFWALTSYDDPFDLSTAAELFERGLAEDLFLVLDVDGKVEGFVCGLSSGLLGNREVKHVTELAWWVNPSARGQGGELLTGLEDAARAIGAKYLNMAALESSMPERVGAIYEARGYRKSETLYTKEI